MTEPLQVALPVEPPEPEPVGKVTAEGIVRALAARHAAPAWAFLEQVPPTTGAGDHRRADAVAMSLYPSRGLEVHGFEVKVARSDWLRELKAPDKTEQGVYRFCDRWWVVAPAGIVLREELPPTWGLMVCRSGSLTVQRQAPQLEAAPLTRGMVASVLRRATEASVPRAVAEARVDAAVADAKERWERRQRSMRDDRPEALRRLAEFEQASGVQIANEWSVGDVGAVVRALLEMRWEADSLAGARAALQRAQEALDAVINAWPGSGRRG